LQRWKVSHVHVHPYPFLLTNESSNNYHIWNKIVKCLYDVTVIQVLYLNHLDSIVTRRQQLGYVWTHHCVEKENNKIVYQPDTKSAPDSIMWLIMCIDKENKKVFICYIMFVDQI
jgi:hypothetical protein